MQELRVRFLICRRPSYRPGSAPSEVNATRRGPLAELSLGYLVEDSKEDREPSEPEPDTHRTAPGERPSEPRAPLSVRRATPEVPKSRVRERSKEPMLSLEWLPGDDSDSAAPSPAAAAPASEPAGSRSRISAALLDGGILVVVDVVVIYLTLQLTMVNLGSLSLTPLVIFLSLLNGGYLGGVYRGWWANPWQDGRWHQGGGVEHVRVPSGLPSCEQPPMSSLPFLPVWAFCPGSSVGNDEHFMTISRGRAS